MAWKQFIFVMTLFLLFTINAYGGEQAGNRYVITIPAVIELGKNDDGTFSAEYEVMVTGGDLSVSVAPEEEFHLSSAGKKNIRAQVEQDSVTFSSITPSATGKVYTTTKLGSGEWTGHFNFKIQANTNIEDLKEATPSDAEEPKEPEEPAEATPSDAEPGDQGTYF